MYIHCAAGCRFCLSLMQAASQMWFLSAWRTSAGLDLGLRGRKWKSLAFLTCQVMVYNPFMATVASSDCLNSSDCVWLERWVAEHFLFLETGALNLKKSSWLLPSYHVQLVLERHLTSYQLHLLQDQGAVLGYMAEVPAKTPAVPLKTFTPLTVMQVFALLAEGRIHVWVRDRLLWLGKIQLQSPQLNKHFL